MASITHITEHAGFTARALATMGTDPAWDQAVTKFLRTDALYRTDETCGRYNDAREKAQRAEMQIEEEFGRNWRGIPAAQERWEPHFAVMREAEDQQAADFLRPLWQAQRELAQTPAPTLAAAIFKVELIEAEDVWNDYALEGNAFQIVADDFARVCA
jgi:hypothetical protein